MRSIPSLVHHSVLLASLAALGLPACGGGAAGGGQQGAPETRTFGVTRAVPGEHATITEALDAAAPGDVVEVAPGEYVEDLVVPSGVTLQGSVAERPVIRGSIVAVGGEDVALIALHLIGPGRATDSVGLATADASVSAVALVVEEFGVGVQLTGVTPGEGPTTLGQTFVLNNGTGVIVHDATNVLLGNNVVLFNDAHGIQISHSDGGANSGVQVVNNSIAGNGYGGQLGAALFGQGEGWVGRNNIAVSNDIGLHCIEGGCDHDHDLVWGNRVDYSGDSEAGANDVSGDPRFVNAGALDLRLQAGSVAIDAGDPATHTSFDALGVERPFGPAPDIGAYEHAPLAANVSLAINEIMSNPLDEARDEFIELYNYGADPVDAAGLLITDGDAVDVLEGRGEGGTVIPPDGYGVVVDRGYLGFYDPLPDGTVVLTVGNATLGNALSNNDPIRLMEPDETVIDSYSFPRNAGNGVSVEKIDVLVGDARDNWTSSPCGNSPGRQNCILDPPIDPNDVLLVITEVMSNPLVERTGEYIELFNNSRDEPFNLRNLRLTDGDTTDQLQPYLNGDTEVPPGGYAVIIDANYEGQYDIPEDAIMVTTQDQTLGNGLAVNDKVTLLSADGAVVLGTYSHTFNAGNGRSVERVSIGLGDLVVNWIPSPCESGGSPGAPNCAFDVELDLDYPVMISEIMANPFNEDRGEYVEVYNYGVNEVDLSTLELGDGDTVDQIEAFPGSDEVMLQPGELAVILDSEYDGVYDIPEGTLLLTTDDTTVGTSLTNNDPIFIFGPDGRLLDSYSSPFNAGNGRSVERKSLLVGDIQRNWVTSPCGHSAGRLNCAISGQQPRVSSAALVISEIMANPLDERTGEFVELFNAGNVAIDLAEFQIVDLSDQARFLGGFEDGPTELAAGDFAVILDPNYDGAYAIPDDALLVTVLGAVRIGNGLAPNTDHVSLLNAGGDVVDSFSHPTDPGNGVSVEKVGLTRGDRDVNWLASCDETGSTPGRKNCQDPNQEGGGRVLNEPCPNGSFDCASQICLLNIFSGDAFCSAQCDEENACPDDFECLDIERHGGEFGGCVHRDHFREPNGEVGSPCPGGPDDCFSGRCLENPRTRLNFCTDDCSQIVCPENMFCVDIGPVDPDPVCIPLGILRDGLTGDGCPNGAIDCVSFLCLQPIEGDAYCTADCSDDACPPGFDCGEVSEQLVCEAEEG